MEMLACPNISERSKHPEDLVALLDRVEASLDGRS
jgi:hypothetical protein